MIIIKYYFINFSNIYRYWNRVILNFMKIVFFCVEWKIKEKLEEVKIYKFFLYNEGNI